MPFTPPLSSVKEKCSNSRSAIAPAECRSPLKSFQQDRLAEEPAYLCLQLRSLSIRGHAGALEEAPEGLSCEPRPLLCLFRRAAKPPLLSPRRMVPQQRI